MLVMFDRVHFRCGICERARVIRGYPSVDNIRQKPYIRKLLAYASDATIVMVRLIDGNLKYSSIIPHQEARFKEIDALLKKRRA